jgi:prevent-host-death family protein
VASAPDGATAIRNNIRVNVAGSIGNHAYSFDTMTRKNGLTVPATEFKARCFQLMDRVEASGVTITITKHGRPVARLVPLAREATSFFGSLPVTIVRDTVGFTGETWDVER